MKKATLTIIASMFLLGGCTSPTQVEEQEPQCTKIQKYADQKQQEYRCEFN